MTCRSCVKLPLIINGIDAKIDAQMQKKYSSSPLFGFGKWRKPYIVTLKKIEGKHIFRILCQIFKAEFLRYFNEVLFEMVKTYLKDTYLGGETTTELQNEVSIF